MAPSSGLSNLSSYQVVLAVGMLITGSINTLSKKAQNQCSSTGLKMYKHEPGDEYHKFDHPWFQTLIMFLGESLCLIGLFYRRYKLRHRMQLQLQTDDASVSEVPEPTRICYLIFAIPTLCDLVGTSLSGIALLWVDASVWQMLRGSIIIFTGVFSKVFLKRPLKITHWLGMSITMVGLMLVGISSVLKPHHSVSQLHTTLGVILIIASQIVSATQMVLEETFLKGRGFHPLHVVGMEGVFGVFFMCALFLPVVYFIPGPQNHNSYDNSIDALIQIGNNYKLALFCVLYLLSIAFYNFFGLAVTKSMTAVHRTLLDACRTILVWLVSLFIYYAVDKDYGEHWNESYGIIQIDGFLLLLIGTCMYNQLFDFSFLRRRPRADTEPGSGSAYKVRNADSNYDDSEPDPLLTNTRKRYDSSGSEDQ